MEHDPRHGRQHRRKLYRRQRWRWRKLWNIKRVWYGYELEHSELYFYQRKRLDVGGSVKAANFLRCARG